MTYVRNAWYVASWSQDLEPGTPSAITILNEPIVIWRSPSGALNALADRCVHRLAPLSLGRCEGERLRCMYHGLLFDPDGKVVEIPGQDMIPERACVRRYAVSERHSWIWVWMGDAEKADPDLIPQAYGFDNPDYLLAKGQLDYAAEACLVNNNLLDFSHLAYVHEKSFKAPQNFAYERPKITTLPRGVRVDQWVRNRPGPGWARNGGLFDGLSSYEFLIPGVLVMWMGSFPLGTAEACGSEQPDYAEAVSGVTVTSQAVTPMTERTARYFFSAGPHRAHGDDAARDSMMQTIHQAFAEDKVMIEAQQRVIDTTPDPRIMPTTADKGVTIFNQLVQKLAGAAPARSHAA